MGCEAQFPNLEFENHTVFGLKVSLFQSEENNDYFYYEITSSNAGFMIKVKNPSTKMEILEALPSILKGFIRSGILM